MRHAAIVLQPRVLMPDPRTFNAAVLVNVIGELPSQPSAMQPTGVVFPPQNPSVIAWYGHRLTLWKFFSTDPMLQLPLGPFPDDCRHPRLEMGGPLRTDSIREVLTIESEKSKKKRRGRTPIWCPTTSAYSVTSPPASPGYPLASHPRTSCLNSRPVS